MERASDPTANARLWRRLAAIFYDALLLTALLLVVTAIIIAAKRAAIDPQTIWFQALVLAVCWLYFCWFWTHGGQTLGMRAWKLRLQDPAGQPVTWLHGTSRFFAAWLAAAPLGAGYLWCLVDSEKLAWHDRVSATRLIHIATTAPLTQPR